ncbi:MAG: Glu-tRNA(Gln) amidotransferase subunit GatE [Bacteroidales bacterium]|jgi:glutamyl-tRNA(Gln) amidotransferase subunit E|nr:Glu-tRNA(Gln) amidotransferase subunit GatE [Bacteroidales bacterium]
MKQINPRKNFEESCKEIGYIDRKEAHQEDYDRIGFMSGLEVHQQLKTDKKLFCHCPAGIFQKPDQFDAEVVRHMRPTLSELGEYDGTALMEFKTRKEITYRLSHPTACTYEVDDTPPFHVDQQALDYAIEVALVSKMSIVGEVHITRKQYLDGSIPTGFQRTAIIGIEGSIPLKNKTIRLIQMSLEEDACREVSDIGHKRIYRTDRLGMPLIETVTYPECMNPDELTEACNYIRFLNRSTGRVRTGIGAGREDVNVSCKGGTRVEIKGVAHTKWIPDLSHNEAFRQWALLAIRAELTKRVKKEDFKVKAIELNPDQFNFYYTPLQDAIARKEKLYVVNLPHFSGMLSHFTQPQKPFYDEFAGRLKVIACIEKPNMATSEDLDDVISDNVFEQVQKLLGANAQDAQIIFWAPEDDVKTAIEVIEERALMAFDGVPNETRKSLADGTTIFERVLPGADRMYPDTDSVPIPLETAHIEELRKNVPDEVQARFAQMRAWGVPEDCFNYLFTHNYYPLIKKMADSLPLSPKFISTFIGHKVKHLHGQHGKLTFNPERLSDLFAFLNEKEIDVAIAFPMVKVMFEHPKIDFESILNILNFKKISKEELLSRVPFLLNKFSPIRKKRDPQDPRNSIMGELRAIGEGSVNLTELSGALKL